MSKKRPEEIRIRWRKYGKGGQFRAEWPDGYVESTSEALVRDMAQFKAVETGWPVVDDLTAA